MRLTFDDEDEDAYVATREALLDETVQSLAPARNGAPDPEEVAGAVGVLVDGTKHPWSGVQELIRDIGAHFALLNRAEHEWTRRVLACARDGGYRVTPSEQTA